MAAEKLAVEKKTGDGGLGLDMIDSLKGMDLGALMKDLDPNMLQELLAEGMNDPALQEMVSFIFTSLALLFGRACIPSQRVLCLLVQSCSLPTLFIILFDMDKLSITMNLKMNVCCYSNLQKKLLHTIVLWYERCNG